MSKTLTFLLFLHDEAELPVCKLEAELEYSSKHRDRGQRGTTSRTSLPVKIKNLSAVIGSNSELIPEYYSRQSPIAVNRQDLAIKL